ncbi:hypothetical protein [Nostoc sp.]
MVTELVVPLRGSKLRAASRREVRATPTPYRKPQKQSDYLLWKSVRSQ